MRIEPYLNFNGRCDEAIEFYKKAIGAEAQIRRFKEMPERSAKLPPGSEEKVMHAAVRIGDSSLFMSDGRCEGETKFDGIALTIIVQSESDANRYFGALSDGGKILMPMAKTFYSPAFGMVSDRFGVTWMILTSQ